MNYELTMLQNVGGMTAHVKSLAAEMKKIALRSYDTLNWKNGTAGQVALLSEMSAQADACKNYIRHVKEALAQTPKGYRALLVAVYIQRRNKKAIADRYGVSLSTVYRKLFWARQRFRRALERAGCTEKWFCDNYGDDR